MFLRMVTGIVVLLSFWLGAFAAPAAYAEQSTTWNGHTYLVVFADNPTWFEARDAAAALTLNGTPGYLATFATREEQESVIGQLGGGATLNALWLGGYQDTSDPGYSENYGGWKWITGEPWLGVAANDSLLPRSDFGFNNSYFDSVHTEEHTITWWQTGGINDYYHSPSAAFHDANGGPSRGFIVEFDTYPAILVAIDIKPGSDPNSINLTSEGKVAVAILSTTEIDATAIDPTTVTIAGAPVSLRKNGKPMASLEDVNGDGLADLVVHVNTKLLDLTAADTSATLTGYGYDGTPITGEDAVRIVR